MREYNFDGLVGPTHNYGGLSPGNVASVAHGGQVSNPREAALQGLEKMRFVRGLGVGPGGAASAAAPEPADAAARSGFDGIGRGGDRPRRRARASTCCACARARRRCGPPTRRPSRPRPTPPTAGSTSRPRTSSRCSTARSRRTRRSAVLRAIFADEARFAVHAPLPGRRAVRGRGRREPHAPRDDEPARGAPLRLGPQRGLGDVRGPQRFPARQTLEASQALARLHRLAPERVPLPAAAPRRHRRGRLPHRRARGRATAGFLMLHELAFVDAQALLATLRETGWATSFRYVARHASASCPRADAVAAYPFNSQVLTLPDGEHGHRRAAWRAARRPAPRAPSSSAWWPRTTR